MALRIAEHFSLDVLQHCSHHIMSVARSSEGVQRASIKRLNLADNSYM